MSKFNPEASAAKIIKLYEVVIAEITTELTDMYAVGSVASQEEKEDQTALLLFIFNKLNELNSMVEPELAKMVKEKYQQSLAKFMVEIGEASSIAKAEINIQFGLHSAAKVDLMTAESFDDLLKATDNVKHNIKKLIQEISAESVKLDYANNRGQQKIADELAKKLTKELLTERIKAEGFTGIIDKSGKKWSIDTYAEMVTKTKLAEVDAELVRTEALTAGIDLAVISSHGATDDCSKWENTVISLHGYTDGFVTYEEVKATNECFHPRCQHHLQAVRDLSLVHDKVLENHYSKLEANQQTVNKMKEAR